LAHDIDRADIPHIKTLLINYLKFVNARSDYSKKLQEEVEQMTIEKTQVLTEEVSISRILIKC